MSNIHDVERQVEQFSLDSWVCRSRVGDDMPPVLYFDTKKPAEFDETGLYIAFQDFRNVRESFTQDVPLTTAYHALVFYFSQNQANMRVLAHKRLYYNPSNSSSWNTNSWTDRFYLHGTTLLPYAAEKVTPEFKIPGIADFGRRILRKVLFDEESPPEPTDSEMFGGAEKLASED